jgi:chromosome partitioning protein
MITLAITNQKGGVGKTTSAVSLSAALARHGQRVLLVDLDAQATATMHLTDAYGEKGRVAYDVLMRRVSIQQIAVRVPAGFDLLPSDLWLANLDIELASEPMRELRLTRALSQVSGSYDYVLIDCPPTLGVATFNALMAARGVIIPIDCRPQAFLAIPPLLQVVKKVAAEKEEALLVFALPTFFQRNNVAKDMVDLIHEQFESGALSPINSNTKLNEAFLARQTIFEYDLTANGSVDYLRVAEELTDAFQTRKAARARQKPRQ